MLENKQDKESCTRVAESQQKIYVRRNTVHTGVVSAYIKSYIANGIHLHLCDIYGRISHDKESERRMRRINYWLGLALMFSMMQPDQSIAQANTVTTIATFECLSIYFDTNAGGDCLLYFRKAGDVDWLHGYPLVYDKRDKQYRGSLVELQPDTEYELRILLGSKDVHLSARTRCEMLPIGKITYLQGGVIGETVTITESGSADGYHLVMPAPGKRTTIDVFNLSDYCVDIDADFVILRGVELENAAIHAAVIRENRQHVVVEDCRVSFWGRIGGPRSKGNLFHGSDSGIYAEKGAGNLIFQRNRIEHPRGAANDWTTGHPSGPQGISLINSSGGNIIRYNEIVSTDDHGFNDGIGGASNFSFAGSPNRDSDIYGNIIENVWDDAIESEGANMNVRIWGNYLNKVNMFIATADVSMGPCYIYRNILAESRQLHGDRLGGTMFKIGDHEIEVDGKMVSTAQGKRFIFHNTALQPNGAFNVFTGGKTINTITRNNILWCAGSVYPDESSPTNNFQSDWLVGRSGYPNAVFQPSHYMEFYLAPSMRRVKFGKTDIVRQDRKIRVSGMMSALPNPGIDAGVPIPGFTNDYKGAGPDMGAFESGKPPQRYGRFAQPEIPKAPWELYP
jgi:hypothetical protein